MNVNMKCLPCMLIFLTLTWQGVFFPLLHAQEETPVIILTNSNGELPEYFRAMDTVYGSFSGLLFETEYELCVIRSDDMEISRSICASDELGIIPTIALWWDVGAEYPDSRVGYLNPDLLSLYTYRFELQRQGIPVAEIPIPVLPLEESGPIVYSSDEMGNPLNMFSYQVEHVYVTGKNFPPGVNVHIYLVSDEHSWEEGDILEPLAGTPYEVTLGPEQQEFTAMIATSSDLAIGEYDIVVEYDIVDGIIDQTDLIDSGYGVGFTISGLESVSHTRSEFHVEAQLACQAPPQSSTGRVIGAPNPVYKDYFSPNEEVWLAVNPYSGGHNYANKKARLYVVWHRTAAYWWNGTFLSDVSGGYETVTIQPGCANVNYTRIWKRPTIRDAGYDVVVDFKPFGVYNKGQDIIDSLDARGFYVPTLWVCLDSVSFNHNTSSTSSDAINIRKNKNTDVRVPEWIKAKECYEAAYIKNKTVTIKAVFSAAAGVTRANIRGVQRYGYLGNVVQKTVYFSGGTSGSVSFQVSSNTPGSIRYFYQRWRWYCGSINGSGSSEVHLADTKNKIYIVLAQPQSPWTTSGQTKPWTKALYRSCYWAWGKTTSASAAEKITQKLFKNVGGRYDTVSGAPRYTSNGGSGSFDLTDFLANIWNVGIVNCYDMGKSLVTFSNVLGCGLSYKFSNNFGYLNCIYAIGRGWTNNPFYDNPSYDSRPIVPEDWSWSEGRSSFGNHAFGGISSNIFDACLTVDTDSNPDYGPPFTETWMINEPWSTYKTKVVDNNPPTSTGDPTNYTFSIY